MDDKEKIRQLIQCLETYNMYSNAVSMYWRGTGRPSDSWLLEKMQKLYDTQCIAEQLLERMKE